jgi:hypothetical protein
MRPETRKQRQITRKYDRHKRHCRASGFVLAPNSTDAALRTNDRYQGSLKNEGFWNMRRTADRFGEIVGRTIRPRRRRQSRSLPTI